MCPPQAESRYGPRPTGSTLATLRFYPGRVESSTLPPTCSRHQPRDDNNQPARRQRIESADRQMATPQQPLRTKPLPPSPADLPHDPRSHGAAWVSYGSQETELPQLPKAFRLAAAKFSRPPSRAAAELRHLPTARLTHGAWSARAHTQPASIRCSVVWPSQQARFSHPPPRWPTEDGAPTWERESRTCRRGSQGAQGEQGARGVTDGSRACGRAGSPAVRRRAAASPLPPSRRHRSC